MGIRVRSASIFRYQHVGISTQKLLRNNDFGHVVVLMNMISIQFQVDTYLKPPFHLSVSNVTSPNVALAGGTRANSAMSLVNITNSSITRMNYILSKSYADGRDPGFNYSYCSQCG